MTYIIYPHQARKAAHLAGGKAATLATLAPLDLPIPNWIVLSPAAFYASLDQAQQDRLKLAKDSASALALLQDLRLSPAVQTELQQALAELSPTGEPVAVRSSALDEDGQQHSFAGQLASFLFVPLEEVAAQVVEVWRSAFSERVLAYRREHDLSPTMLAPAVLIQRMVKADLSGVAFSADPITGQRDMVVIGAVSGLGTALVSGEVDADTYYVDPKGQLLRSEWADKSEARAGQAVLTAAQLQALATLTQQVTHFFGCPQDIEWAIAKGRLYLLQARPLTGLPQLAEPEGMLNVWDNSNIAESYPGMTTPLTFSFARRAYEEVYRQFCRMMGVPAATIAAQANTFRCMLGLIQGRIYYNLLNWYRVLAMLPGFTVNRRFMEQMMGVKESLPESLLNDLPRPTWGARLQDSLYLLGTVGGLIANYLLLPRRIEAFYQRLEQALGPSRPDLSHWSADELAAYYRNLERQLLTRWDAPLINDFFAMIFYGLLRRLAEKWCGDGNDALQNALLSHTGGIISAEPARRLRQMAQLAAQTPELVTVLCTGSPSQISEAMAQAPEFVVQYQAYLDQFGERCLEELKLESPTLHDDPLPLLRSVGRLAGQGEVVIEANSALASRQQAEQSVTEALAHQPLRRLFFNWILQNARTRMRDRENLRFERTRLFGRARAIFVELGRRLHSLDLLVEPRDIFYLEVEEVLGFINGTASTTDLKGLVTLRRAEFERYRAMPAPPDRFETRGLVYRGNSFHSQDSSEMTNGRQWQGLGCCPGLVRGRVRIITDPKNAHLQRGDILVAERTDPGWIMLFPAAAGLLVEYGSLLSHSAIVARELGLPAIVSLKGVTRWLKDGDWVEFDGRSGLVTKLEGAYV